MRTPTPTRAHAHTHARTPARARTHTLTHTHTQSRAIPLQTWNGPDGSRKLQFPDFITMAQDDGKVVRLMQWLPLPLGSAPGTHFC